MKLKTTKWPYFLERKRVEQAMKLIVVGRTSFICHTIGFDNGTGEDGCDYNYFQASEIEKVLLAEGIQIGGSGFAPHLLPKELWYCDWADRMWDYHEFCRIHRVLFLQALLELPQ